MIDFNLDEEINKTKQHIVERISQHIKNYCYQRRYPCKMSFQEMDSLMDQLLKLENPYQCPHGRPTIISMSKHELEKKFKRIV